MVSCSSNLGAYPHSWTQHDKQLSDNGCVYCSSTGQVDRSALIQCDGVRGSDGEIELGRRN